MGFRFPGGFVTAVRETKDKGGDHGDDDRKAVDLSKKAQGGFESGS